MGDKDKKEESMLDETLKDLDMAAIIEASKDENGNIDTDKALGGALGAGYTSSDDYGRFSGMLDEYKRVENNQAQQKTSMPGDTNNNKPINNSGGCFGAIPVGGWFAIMIIYLIISISTTTDAAVIRFHTILLVVMIIGVIILAIAYYSS